MIKIIVTAKPAGYEDVPFIQEVLKDKKYKSVADFLVGMQVIGRPFAVPPGISKDRLKILRDAFEKSVIESECVAFAEKAGRPVALVLAEEAQKWAQGLFELPAGPLLSILYVLQK